MVQGAVCPTGDAVPPPPPVGSGGCLFMRPDEAAGVHHLIRKSVRSCGKARLQRRFQILTRVRSTLSSGASGQTAHLCAAQGRVPSHRPRSIQVARSGVALRVSYRTRQLPDPTGGFGFIGANAVPRRAVWNVPLTSCRAPFRKPRWSRSLAWSRYSRCSASVRSVLVRCHAISGAPVRGK